MMQFPPELMNLLLSVVNEGSVEIYWGDSDYDKNKNPPLVIVADVSYEPLMMHVVE